MIAPVSINGIRLTSIQRSEFSRLMDPLLVDAGHPLEVAYELAIRVFTTRLYSVVDGKFRANETIYLANHSRDIRHGRTWVVDEG